MTAVRKLDFDINFQKSLLCLLMKDHSFSTMVLVTDQLPPALFDFAPHAWLYTEIKSFYEKYSLVPSREVIAREINRSNSPYVDGNNKEVLLDIVDNFVKYLSPDVEKYIKDQVTSFVKYQKTRIALKGCVDQLKEGKFDEILESITKAVHSVDFAEDRHHEIQIFTDHSRIDRRFDAPIRGIPTNISGLDKYLSGGGLCKGELGIILGPTSRGKSFFLMKMGRSSLFYRKKVLHLSLEMNEEKIAERYDQCFAELPKSEMFTAEGAGKLRKFFSKRIAQQISRGGKEEALIIKWWPQGTIGTKEISAFIKRKKTEGFVPDVVIVDYGDLLKPSTSYQSSSEYTDYGRIFHDLAAVAAEQDVALWTASQTNRASVSKKVVTLDDIADSWKKVHPAHVVLALCQTSEEYENNEMRVFIAKNREGDKEKSVRVKTNFSISTIKSLEQLDPIVDDSI